MARPGKQLDRTQAQPRGMTTYSIESTLDEVRMFANSANSVRVFEALADGPTTSRELAERTGAAQSTVGRILNRGKSRGWVESEGSRYELASLGEIMIEEFRAYLRTVEGIQHLGEVIEYLPEPAHELEYHHLRDATITRSTAANPAEPFDRSVELLRAAETFPRVLATTVTPRHAKVSWELWSAGREAGEVVVAAGFIETLRDDPERAEPWVDWAREGFVWVHDDVRINVLVFDEVVEIWLGEGREDDVYVAGTLESENPAVISWAESLYDDYRAEAERLTPETLSGE